MKNQTPNLLICLGPSLAGKTTLIKAWQEAFPDYEHVDDRPVVMEYLALDELVHEATSTEQLIKSLKQFGQTSRYLTDLSEQYISEINKTSRIPRPRYCVQTIDYGQGDRRPALDYQIGDPAVWDDILTRLGRSLLPNKKYILEFARGHRDIYLKEHNIKPADVYPRALSCLMSSMPDALKQSAAIIHITCDFDERFKRNNIRRKTTGQELPDSVLCDVFKNDVFESSISPDKSTNENNCHSERSEESPSINEILHSVQDDKSTGINIPETPMKKTNHDQILRTETCVDELQIPTVSIRNDREIPVDEQKEYFARIVQEIISNLTPKP